MGKGKRGRFEAERVTAFPLMSRGHTHVCYVQYIIVGIAAYRLATLGYYTPTDAFAARVQREVSSDLAGVTSVTSVISVGFPTRWEVPRRT